MRKVRRGKETVPIATRRSYPQVVLERGFQVPYCGVNRIAKSNCIHMVQDTRTIGNLH